MQPRSAERMVFFTDAVAAIAMTLLILPLMESIPEASAARLTAAEWIGEHQDQLLGFVLSFALIASFWRGHHALYEQVERYTQPLLLLNFAWMFTIVALPVSTAISFSLSDDAPGIDTSSVIVYLGTLISTAAISCLTQLYVRRHPELWAPDEVVDARGLALHLALLMLFVLALLVALALPQVNYLATLLLLFTAPLARLLLKVLQPRATGSGEPAGTDPAP